MPDNRQCVLLALESVIDIKVSIKRLLELAIEGGPYVTVLCEIELVLCRAEQCLATLNRRLHEMEADRPW